MVALDDGFKKGQIIGYYAGEYRAVNALRGSNPYCLGITKGFIIDAEHCGNELRYINDPRTSPHHPNLDRANVESISTHYLSDGNVKTLAILAKKDIRAGEELLWSYGEEFWNTYGEKVTSRITQEELSMEDFVKRHIVVKKKGSVKKLAVRKAFQQLSPNIFKSAFGDGKSRSSQVKFGLAFTTLMKRIHPDVPPFGSYDSYAGISLVNENETPKPAKQSRDDEVADVAPVRKRTRLMLSPPVERTIGLIPVQLPQHVVDSIDWKNVFKVDVK